MVGVKRRSGAASGAAESSDQVSLKKQRLQPSSSHKNHNTRKTTKHAAGDFDSADSEESDVTDGHRFNGLAGSDDEESDGDSGSETGVRMTGALPVDDAKQNKKTTSDTETSLLKSTSSKEAHAKQKTLAQERKAAKPNADLIQRSKKIWERLRRKSHVPLAERKKLIEELFGIITGRVKDFVLKHDAVRVIQTAIKYGNLEQRKMITRELQGEFRGLAESRYAKFLIGKLLVHGDNDIRDMIIPEFYGHVRRLIKHVEASWILDDIYRTVATPEQKANILREWYGPEFVIFRANAAEGVPVSALSDITKAQPEKRATIMASLYELINQLVQKKMTGFTLLHDAMLQYYLNVKTDSEDATEFLELIKGDEAGDLLKNLAFTKSGSRLVCLVLAHGTAKDRKQILRTYKDIIPTMAFDANAHLVLLVCFDVIDDTVLTSKAIFPELLGKGDVSSSASQQQTLLDMIVDLNARVPVLYLFAGPAKWLVPTSTSALLDEVHDIRVNTSKKDADVRRKELLRSLSPPLLAFIAQQAPALLQTSFGCQFITEVIIGSQASEEERLPALQAVAAVCEGNPADDGHIISSPAAGKLLKTLVQGGKFNQKSAKIELVELPLDFGDLLFDKIQDHVVGWATGDGSFVVVGLLEAQSFSRKKELLDTLRKNKKALVKASQQNPKKEEDGGVQLANGKKGASKQSAKEGGNKGAKILLEKL